MSAYSRAGHHGEVLRLFRSLPFAPTSSLFTTLISSLSASGRPLAARAAFASLLKSGAPPTASAFTALLKSSHDALDFVDSVFRAMDAAGCSPDAPVYNWIISMLCDFRLLQEALGFLDHMLENGPRPTARSFTAVLRVYCEQERFHEAERLVDTMIQNGCPPDVVSYSVLIEGLCRVGEFSKVEMILGESELNGWKPTAVTYNIYMSGLCRMGFLDEAFQQVDVMRSRGLSVTTETVHILFDCLCRNAMFSEAVCLLEHSKELGWNVDAFCYNTLMSRLCDIDDFARVLKLLVDLLKKGIGPDKFSFTIAIRSLCRAGKLWLAKCMIDNKGIKYDVVAFNTLIHGFCMAGDLDRVQQTRTDMINRDIIPNNFTNAMLIDSLCKDLKFVEAKRFVLDSLVNGLVPDHIIRLNNWLVKANKITLVLKLLYEIRCKGFVLDTCIINPLVRVFCWEGYCRHDKFYQISPILDIITTYVKR
uniref:Pentacotripeptide-repeat region of PRORP domain-containing protein n=2 Tax=Oryza brachyantha TaxID=4533 RepID=J3LLF2_ORYBR